MPIVIILIVTAMVTVILATAVRLYVAYASIKRDRKHISHLNQVAERHTHEFVDAYMTEAYDRIQHHQQAITLNSLICGIVLSLLIIVLLIR